MTWNVSFVYTQDQAKSKWVNANKTVSFSDNATIFFNKKIQLTKTYSTTTHRNNYSKLINPKDLDFVALKLETLNVDSR